MAYVYSLAYEDGPDYARMKKMFHKELGSCGFRDDSKALDWIASGKKVRGTTCIGNGMIYFTRTKPVLCREWLGGPQPVLCRVWLGGP